MGVAFERWLARRSTLCFLRRLVAATDNSACVRSTPPRRRHATTSKKASGVELRSPNSAGSSREDRQWTIGKTGTPTSDESNETALRISLNSGVQLFEPSTQPGEAIRALRRQADVASGHAVGKLAVDRPENLGNLTLWAELLQYRQRVDGFEGVLDVWRGMKRRDIDLPIKGNEANVLWTTFIHASIQWPLDDRHDRLLLNIVEHARDLNTRLGLYDGLHKCIVGRWIRVYPASARHWHEILCKDFDNLRIQWDALAVDFVHTVPFYEARKAFKFIYLRSQRRDLYGYYVPELLKHKGEVEALRWHRLFLQNGDGPDQDIFADPAVQRLFEMDGDASLPMIHTKRHPLAAPSDGPSHEQPRFPPLTRATMSTLVGDVHGIKPKEVSDSFVAKMFATHAFSLDLVITGLGFFGVENLGALAVREMALKAGTFVVFSNKLGDLKASGIGIDKSVYGRLVQKITLQGPSQLFETLMESDQHPESYEDASTLELLLHSFLQNDDWTNAHLTLMSLSLTGHVAHARAWNRLLQHYLKKGDYRSISRTAEQMQTAGMAYNKRTLNFLRRYLLPVRRPSKGPLPPHPEARFLNPLEFTTNAYISAATKGVHVDPYLWVEILKRYGLMHKWNELERLVLWLAHWYSTHAPQHRYLSGGQWVQGNSQLRTILSRHMRDAIVTWGFRQASQNKLLRPTLDPETRLVCEPWANGLLLIHKLRGYGIGTTPENARKAFLTRMWILFGPGYSTKAVNVETKRNNRLTLAHYVRHANDVWGGTLFPNLDNSLTNSDPSNHPKLLVALFGRRHRVSSLRQEHADVLAYAQVLEHRRVPYLPSRSNGLARRKIWHLSPFRVVASNRPTRRVERNRIAHFGN